MKTWYFVDENDLALAKKLEAEHGSVVYPGHPGIPIGRGAPDDQRRLKAGGLLWSPTVGCDHDKTRALRR